MHGCRAAEGELFATLGAAVDERVVKLAGSGLGVRVLSHGSGPPVVLLHGVSLTAATWAPLFGALPGHELLAVDLPGHGLSDPVDYRRGAVRAHARQLIDDLLDALELERAPVERAHRRRRPGRPALDRATLAGDTADERQRW